MNDQAIPVRFFASKSITGHLLRGAAAAAFIVAAVKINTSMPVVAVLAGFGALVMLRGCPMCWTMGLIETVYRRYKK
jgi:hypothetical protein